MDTLSFARARPHLFHLTAVANLAGIRAMRRLLPAAAIIGDDRTALTSKRGTHLVTTFEGQQISIRDQKPLYPGKIAFEAGWTFARFVEELNHRVFFWPGNGEPISYGRRHFERYADEKPIVLRVGFESLRNANPDLEPEVCKYNSGSPRFNSGNPSPRGPTTFQPMAVVDLRPSQVVEVTFRGQVILPDVVEFSDCVDGAWRSVWA